MGGVSPRKKFSGLFKAQKPKISKTAHKKLRESLKIFDFDSESDGEDDIAEKKPIKSKAPPTSKAVTKEVKGEEDNVAIKTQTNSNYRYINVLHVHMYCMFTLCIMYTYIHMHIIVCLGCR